MDILRSYTLNPKSDKLVKEALLTLSSLQKTAFGKKLNELGYDGNDDAFDLSAIFALNVLNELSTFNHKPLCDLAQKRVSIDGCVLTELVLAGFHRLASVKDNLNTINVFPVPDGDTGTNMYNCLKEPSRALFEKKSSDVRVVSGLLAEEVVQNGQGNSGTILAHFFISVAKRIEKLNKSVISAQEFANVLVETGSLVSGAVTNPKEGTLVSVARVACEKLQKREFQDLSAVLCALHEAAAEELEKTPDQLTDSEGKFVLKDAGVVDSGAKGFVAMVEGMALASKGKFEEYIKAPTKYWQNSSNQDDESSEFRSQKETYSLDSKFRYCTECVIDLKDGYTKDDVSKAVRECSHLGDSVVCIGSSSSKRSLAKIHIHCNEPGKLFDMVSKFSRTPTLLKEKVNDMYQQVRDEETEAFDPKKMKKSKILLMLDGCVLPDRMLKHCALCPIWILHGGVCFFFFPQWLAVSLGHSLSLTHTYIMHTPSQVPLRLGETHTYNVNKLCNRSRHHFEPLETGAPLPLQVKRKIEMSLQGNDKILVCAIIAAAASATYRNTMTAIKMLPKSLQSRIHLYDRSEKNVSTGYLGNNSTMGLEALRVIESGDATVEKVISRMQYVDDRLYSMSFISSNTVNRLAKWRPKLFWWLSMLPQLKDVKKGTGTMEDPFGVNDGYVFSCGLFPQVVPPGKPRDPRTKMANFMRWSAHRKQSELEKLKRDELENLKSSLKPGQVIRDFCVSNTIRIDVANAFAKMAADILPCKEPPIVLDPTLVTAALLGYEDLWAFYWIDDGNNVGDNNAS